MKYLSFTFLVLLIAILSVAQGADQQLTSYQQAVPGSDLQISMVAINGGNFLMGSSEADAGHKTDEGPQRNLHMSPFWMGALELSRDAFDVFYKDENTSQNSTVDAVTRPSSQYIDFSQGMGKEGGYPVNSLSQYAALMYCRWLYEKTGIFYRLPTEAEWEYACRAGEATAYSFGPDVKELEKYGWYKKNSEGKFQKSGQKLPNAFGLYDMYGNVAEWTLDHYDEKTYGKLVENSSDPTAIFNTSHYPKVLKGGSYMDDAPALRSANRIPSEPIWNRRDPQLPKSKWWLTDAPFIGFRIMRPAKAPLKDEADAFYKQWLGN